MATDQPSKTKNAHPISNLVPPVLRRNPRLSFWAGAELASAFGDQFLIVAIAASAALHQSAVATGLVIAAGAVPRALLSLAGGVIVDRIGSRCAMLLADTCRVLILGVGALIVYRIGPTVELLVVVAVISGAFGALFEPGSTAIAPALVGENQLIQLSALRMGLSRVGALLGAPVAGAVLLTSGVSTAFAVDAVSFAVSATGLLLLRPPKLCNAAGTDASDTGPAGMAGQLLDGLRYVLGHRLLRPALLTVAGAEFALVGAVNSGLPLLAAHRAWGATGIGILIACFGAGSVIGPLAAPTVARTSRPVAIGLGFAATGAIGFAFTAWMRPLALAALLTAILGAAISLLATQLVPAVQQACAPKYLGRLGGLMTLTLTGSAPLSIFVAAALSAVFGTAIVIAAAGATAAAICLSALGSTELRRVGHAQAVEVPAGSQFT